MGVPGGRVGVIDCVSWVGVGDAGMTVLVGGNVGDGVAVNVGGVVGVFVGSAVADGRTGVSEAAT